MVIMAKCRIWWPKDLLSSKTRSNFLLFGWFIPSSYPSLDVVVAAAAPVDHMTLPPLQSDLQEILHHTNGEMAAILQDRSPFSVVGMMENPNVDILSESFNGEVQRFEMEEDAVTKFTRSGILHPQYNKERCGEATCAENGCRWNCGCHELNKVLESHRQFSIANDNWIQLSYDFHGLFPNEIEWIPKLHHMHWNRQLFSICDVHIIIYEQPAFGVQHFSLTPWNSSEQIKAPFQRPKWVHELDNKQPLSDLDTVFLALNSAVAAKKFIERGLNPNRSVKQSQTRLLAFLWHSVAMMLASIFTLFYIVLQFCHGILTFGSEYLICTILEKIFNHLSKNLHIRCCQILYWPIFFRDSGFRSQSNVEYAHRAALRRHSVWSKVVVDVLLGNIFGLTLLLNVEAAHVWILLLVRNITNNLLRSGCVWLMGVPAGFKLNTEFAGVLGMISLNAIQIWSTLWFFMGFVFRYFMKGLAISGILFGLTVPASLCIDMLKLATLHLSTLHWLISLLYSQQIQALASLWRLFRGRKWNPLRQRFDSYDYTVEEHVVGSLLFTPLLLVVPTTSVFYMFFTIMNVAISCLCFSIEFTVSILHATPYVELLLWMVRPRIFPSGVWFDIVSDQSGPRLGVLDGGCSQSDSHHKTRDKNTERNGVVVSFLRSNFANIGQIFLPNYKNMFPGVSQSVGVCSAYGILSGQRIPSTLGTGLPSRLPWIHVRFREYWRLCLDSILMCGSDQ